MIASNSRIQESVGLREFCHNTSKRVPISREPFKAHFTNLGANMTSMFDYGPSERPYWDRKNWSTLESYKEALKVSTTLYVGNLSFYTQESQIYALFEQVGTFYARP